MIEACWRRDFGVESQACIRTFRMSVGVAMEEPIAPDIEPASILIYSGVFLGSVPPSMFLNGSYIPSLIVL